MSQRPPFSSFPVPHLPPSQHLQLFHLREPHSPPLPLTGPSSFLLTPLLCVTLSRLHLSTSHISNMARKHRRQRPKAKKERPETQQDVLTMPSLVFSVDDRAMAVIQCLFSTTGPRTGPTEVSWGDFLHTMRQIGFLGVHTKGSIWTFKPTMVGIDRPISFHQPHPCSKIQPKSAKKIGGRLWRVFGWQASMFVPCK
jgi:hypothetical protein